LSFFDFGKHKNKIIEALSRADNTTMARSKNPRRSVSASQKAPRNGQPPVEPVAEDNGGAPMKTMLESSWQKLQDKAYLCVERERQLLEEKNKL